jgi:small subunit ribosomal protein S1
MEQEVLDTTNSEDFALMLEESLKDKDNSKVVDGVIIEIKEDENLVFVDVNEKNEGRLNIDEIKENGELSYKVGDTLPVLIVGFRNEKPIVSYRKALSKKKVKEFIDEHKSDEEFDVLIDGKIVKKNRGGYIVVNSDGVEFFLPKSLAAFRDETKLIGKSLKAKVIKINEESDSIVISRKRLLEEERKKKRKQLKEILNAEEALEGVVKKIASYGMFVEVNELEGLVHYNEISYKGPVNPAKLYSEGDKVFVKAIEYDKSKKHLFLSIKAAMPDPWEEIKEELDKGDVIEVTVSNIEPYGAFVDLGNDTEGFLHISEITWDKNIKHPKDYLTIGERVNVEVIEIDSENRKLRVSLKTLQPKPFEEFLSKYKEGGSVTGKVTTLTDFGAFVQIDKIEGLLHNEDASWDKSNKCKDNFKVGDEVEVKIIKIDRDKERVSLNRKDLIDSPAKLFSNEHKVGDSVKGKIKDVKEFGVFVNITGTDVDALIRVEDLTPLKRDEIKIGDDIEGIITIIDTKNNKVRMSVKKLAKKEERDTLKAINSDDDKMTLGDVLRDKL